MSVSGVLLSVVLPSGPGQSHKTFSQVKCLIWLNKLVPLTMTHNYYLGYSLRQITRNRVYLSCSLEYVLAYVTNIRLGWKLLYESKTLAYSAKHNLQDFYKISYKIYLGFHFSISRITCWDVILRTNKIVFLFSRWCIK